jgi:hypothetical protein
MFWVGLAIAVVGGLLGVQLWRNWIQSRLPQATNQAFDITRSTLLIIGALIAVAGYMHSGRENKASRREITEVRQELTDSQQKQAAAEQALREVQAQQQPRTLTRAQLHALLPQLRNGPKGRAEINAVAGDAESDRYAEQFYGVLAAGGWTMEGFGQVQYIGEIPVGLRLDVGRADMAPHGEFLLQILRALGLEVLYRSNQNVPEGVVLFTTGQKPWPRQ